MSKKCYRFFGGLLTVQKNWLNKMAEKVLSFFWWAIDGTEKLAE